MGSTYEVESVFRSLCTARQITERISLFTVITRENAKLREIEQILMRAVDAGITQVDFGVIKLLGKANRSSLPEQEELIPLLRSVRRLADSYGIKSAIPDIEKRTHPCTHMTYSVAVFPDRTVRECSFESDSRIGSLDEMSLRSIWNGHTVRKKTCDKCSPGGYRMDSPLDAVSLVQLNHV
jgi:MoaA/NifB/PqqE/SkfB family radical SAM enzyme